MINTMIMKIRCCTSESLRKIHLDEFYEYLLICFQLLFLYFFKNQISQISFKQIMLKRGVIYFLCIYMTLSTLLSLNLTPDKKFCFREDLPKHSLIRLEAVNDNFPFRVQIRHLDKIILNQTTSQIFYQSLTTQDYGIHEMCMTNLHRELTNLRFQFLSGIRAKDFSSYADHGDAVVHLKEQAKIAQLFIEEIRKQNIQGLLIIAQHGGIYSSESTELFFTFCFIICSAGLTFMQYQIIYNHMRTRKYI